ncbi:GNAT family N-acetyltransferase [Mucilaginibacter sp. CAU 1740]|uniref:GNAT family N-acetyltransferase n=1 Tax=Mucilaginibacter sp. CAU 1740 TaxID=3140365 RepID=UPI00325B4DBE
MENFSISKITVDQVAKLRQISTQTFTETFAAVNTEEDMAQYVAESLSVDKLTAEVSNELSQFYFAVIAGEIVGYLKLNLGTAQTELKENTGLEIERIYVLKEFHGKQVGQLLYNKAIDVANEINAEYVWLGVWEKNFRAMRFYEKNGFVAFDKHPFWLGTDEQIDIMMKKVLLPENTSADDKLLSKPTTT